MRELTIRNSNDFSTFFLSHNKEKIGYKNYVVVNKNFGKLFAIEEPHNSYSLYFYMSGNCIDIKCVYSRYFNLQKCTIKPIELQKIESECEKQGYKLKTNYDCVEKYTRMFLCFDKEIKSSDIINVFKIILDNVL